jgi:hypothetical protein
MNNRMIGTIPGRSQNSERDHRQFSFNIVQWNNWTSSVNPDSLCASFILAKHAMLDGAG